MKYKDMNKHQQLVVRKTHEIFNNEVGGWVNLIYDSDDFTKYIPATREAAENWIYDMVVDEAPKEARFAGAEFTRKIVNLHFKKDDDIEWIADEMGW